MISLSAVAQDRSDPLPDAMETGFGQWRLFWSDLPLAYVAMVARALTFAQAADGPLSPTQVAALMLGCGATALQDDLS